MVNEQQAASKDYGRDLATRDKDSKSHKSHKSKSSKHHKSSKSSKHHRRSRSSDEEGEKMRDRQHSKHAPVKHAVQQDEVGSDPESGEIVALQSAADDAVAEQQHAEVTTSKPVTDELVADRVRHGVEGEHGAPSGASAPPPEAGPLLENGDELANAASSHQHKTDNKHVMNGGSHIQDQGQEPAVGKADSKQAESELKRASPDSSPARYSKDDEVIAVKDGNGRASSRDPPREKDRERQRSRDRGSRRDDRDDRSRHDSVMARERERERERSKDSRREREASRDGSRRDRDGDRERSRQRDRSRDDSRREREREQERERSKERRERDDRMRRERDRSRDTSVRRGDSRQPGGSDRSSRYRDERDRGRSERERERERERDREDRRREGTSPSRKSRAPDNLEQPDSKKRRTDSEDEPEIELPAALVEDSEEAEQRAIEERRKRLAEIKAKHQLAAAAADAIINPTASALARPASTLSLAHAAASVMASSVATGQAPAHALADTAATTGGQHRPMNVDSEQAMAIDSAQAGQVNDGDGGFSTPEASSSSGEGIQKDGPVLDIWGAEVTRDAEEFQSRSVQPGTGPAAASVLPDGGKSTQVERMMAQAKTTAKQQNPALPRTAEEETGRGGDDDIDDMFAAAEEYAQKKVEEGGQANDDMFAETAEKEDDMFASDDETMEAREGRNRTGAMKKRGAAGAQADVYDDQEGYYNFQIGELMDKRYEVFASNGKGVFSVVVRARDLARKEDSGQHPEVAIKMIRANETMYKAAATEIAVLDKLGKADPDNRKHVIRLLRHFEYRNHRCLVFEPMAMNLRDLTKKVGRNKGLNVEAVQLFACQLLIALRHLKKNEVLHADIKPDNILINHKHNRVKICDFGSAMWAGDNEVTPYLVSRFYRPPEVVLGMKYDYAMDMWSIGCVLYELFTGRILFPGHTNNEMLKLFMDVKGAFPKKMLKKCTFTDKHFDTSDQNYPFISLEDDPITKTKVRKLIHNPQAKAPLSVLLARGSGDKNKIAMLADLLDKMMMLEPEKRIDPDAALRHPFCRDILPAKDHSKSGKHKPKTNA